MPQFPAATDTPLPDGDFRFIALDVETACGPPSSICQIGLACVDQDNGIQTYATFVDPQQPFAAFNTQLHGISAATVRGAPTFPQIWEQMQPLLSRHSMVQHSRFDEHAIDAACDLNGLPRPHLCWSDSVKIARDAWPELRGNGGHGLANLKKVLGLQFHHHDAGEDARASALVVLQAEARLKRPFQYLSGRKISPQLAFDFGPT